MAAECDESEDGGDGVLDKILTWAFGDEEEEDDHGIIGLMWDRINRLWNGSRQEDGKDEEDDDGTCVYHWCSRCDSAANVYCVECAETLCFPCCDRAHHPGTYSELHSLERFQVHNAGVKLFTPMTAFVCIVILIWFFFTSLSISDDYLFRADICPAVEILQQATVWIDAGIFYWLKFRFVQCCGVEDSFWKLLLDTWVRTIVTNTDSFLVLLISLPQALLFQVIACSTLVPILALAYASIVCVLHSVEDLLPRCAVFERWEKAVMAFGNYTTSVIAREIDYPPVTLPRGRLSQDTLDFCRYWYERRTRWFRFYYQVTKDVTKRIIQDIVLFIVFLRSFCILLNTGWILRAFFMHVGLKYKIEAHLAWFASASKEVLGPQFDAAVWSSVSRLTSYFVDATLNATTSTLFHNVVFFLSLLVAIPVLHLSFSRGILSKAHFRVCIGLAFYPLILVFALTHFARRLFVLLVISLCLIHIGIHKVDKRLRRVFEAQRESGRTLTVGECLGTTGGICPRPCTHPVSCHHVSKQDIVRRQETSDGGLEVRQEGGASSMSSLMHSRTTGSPRARSTKFFGSCVNEVPATPPKRSSSAARAHYAGHLLTNRSSTPRPPSFTKYS